MAIKLMTLVRTDDVARWRLDLLAQLSRRPKGLSRLLFNKVLPVQVREIEGSDNIRWDAVVEGWFDNQEDLDAWVSRMPGAKALAQLVVDQHLIHDSGTRPLPIKMVVPFRRLASKSRAEAQAHWRGRHVEIGLVEHNAKDFLKLYLQNHVREHNRTEHPEHDYDGLPEIWVDQSEMAEVGPDSPVMRAIAEDEKNFTHIPSLVTLVLEEEQLFARSQTPMWAPGTL